MDVKEHGMKNETVNFPATNVGVDSPNNTPHDTDETNPNFRCLYERTLVSAVSSFLALRLTRNYIADNGTQTMKSRTPVISIGVGIVVFWLARSMYERGVCLPRVQNLQHNPHGYKE